MRIFQRALMITIERVKSYTEVSQQNTILLSQNYKKDIHKNYTEQTEALFQKAKNSVKSLYSKFVIIWDIEPEIDYTIAFARTLAKNISASYFNGVLAELKIVFTDKIQKDNLQSLYRSQFTLIPAAGGLVYNDNKEILLIYRKNKWDLPKGKIEVHEPTNECAIREVQEETGIKELQIIEKLASTYHEYTLNDKPILKRTEWFLMKSNYKDMFEPQLIEDITEVIWKPLSYADIQDLETYPLIKYVLQKGLKRIL
jgi:8-oxo-dGTP pyrophosphatase MutT (NUDIX family)